jgi:hypothetical protein
MRCSRALNSAPRTGRRSSRWSKRARCWGSNLYAYIADVLARIVTRADTDTIDDLLPYNWVDTNAAQTMFEMSDIASAA